MSDLRLGLEWTGEVSFSKKKSGSSVIFGSMDVTLWVASSDKNAVWGSTDK